MLENKQAAVKKDHRKDGHVWVHSIFPTVQGEGPFAGTPCVFIRLAGCNLQCPFCDTEYTEGAKLAGPLQVAAWAKEAFPFAYKPNHDGLVVITGGEPFRQNIYYLVNELLDLGLRVQIETNGTLYHDLPARYGIDIVCSPKTGTIHRNLWPFITALKYVARAEDLVDSVDGLPTRALGHPAAPILARPPTAYKGPVYLQPVDEQDPAKNMENILAVQSSCMRHGYTLCLQLHKITGAP